MALSPQLKAKVESYRPSETAINLAAQSNFLLVAGPSGSGKSSVISKLLKTGRFSYIVSHTTRAPRAGEINGQNYFFIDEAAFEGLIDQHELVEAEVIYDQYCSGTSRAAIQRVKDSGQIGVTDIDVSGVKTYMELNPNNKAVFILPPSYEEWVSRLTGRGEDADTVKTRLTKAQAWLETALEAGYFRFVINSQTAKAVADILDFIDGSENVGDDQLVEHAWHVLGELKTQLNS